MMRIKKNDNVIIISGKDKGKQGAVLEVLPEKNLVKVRGINQVFKHMKARRQGQSSAIKKMESYVDLSNVMLISPIDSKPSRVNFKILEDGKKVRICNRTKEIV